MALRHAAALILCAASIAFAGAPALAQSTPQPPGGNVGTNPNFVVPQALPDLVIASAVATATCTSQKTVTAKIAATVKNISKTGTANLSNVTWQIVMSATWWPTSGPATIVGPTSQTVTPQVGGPKTLPPGATWTGNLGIAGIPRYKTDFYKQGNYGFEVVADPGKAIVETDEKNNKLLTYALDPCYKK